MLCVSPNSLPPPKMMLLTSSILSSSAKTFSFVPKTYLTAYTNYGIGIFVNRAVLPFLCLLSSTVSISYLFNSARNNTTAGVSRGIGASSSTASPLYLTSSSSNQDLYRTDIRDSLTNVLPPGFDRASNTIDTKKKCDICM